MYENMSKIEQYNLEQAAQEAEGVQKEAQELAGEGQKVENKHYFEASRRVDFAKAVAKEGFITGDEAVELAMSYYKKIALEKMKELGIDPQKYDYIEIDWEKFKDFLFLKEGLGSSTEVIFIPNDSSQEFKDVVSKIANNSFFYHVISGWNKGSSETLEDAAGEIEDRTFKRNTGFYVTSKLQPWSLTKGNGLRLYFNEDLVKLITPTLEAIREVFQDEYFKKDKWGQDWKNKNDAIDFSKSVYLESTGSRSTPGTFDEKGDPLKIISLLGKSGIKLPYYNDVLGVLLHTSFEKIEIDGKEKVAMGPLDPKLIKIIAIDDSEIFEENKLLVESWDAERMLLWEFNKSGKNKLEDNAIAPVKRITADIVSGVIEFEGYVAKRVAIPEGDKMKIYDQGFVEQERLKIGN